MGSFFAGVKAGTLAGLVYLGGIAAFNVAILYALKGDVLSQIRASYSAVCGGIPTESASLQSCFNSVVAIYVPFIAFIGFFVALVYSAIFGRFYEAFPGGRFWMKGETLAAVVGISLLYFGLSGIYFDYASKVAGTAFFVVWTLTYGLLMGKLYSRYTRVVRFESQDPSLLKISVDGRDFTGKVRTFSLKSVHVLRAEVSEDASFKEWTVSGGVTVEDQRSFETEMDVNGDGLLKAQVSKKY